MTKTIKEQFKDYLYKEYSNNKPSNPKGSTNKDYFYWVERVIWTELATNIDEIIKKYDKGGEKEYFGNKSHSTCINGLKSFKEFLKIEK